MKIQVHQAASMEKEIGRTYHVNDLVSEQKDNGWVLTSRQCGEGY